MVTLINLVLLCMTKFPERDFIHPLHPANIFFFFFFTSEVVLKIYGYGFKFFMIDAFNRVDAFVVLLNCMDLFMEMILLEDVFWNLVHLFRGFAVFRIIKFFKTWYKMTDLLRTTGKILKDISQFTILMMLFILVFCLLGMEMFAYQVKFDTDNMPVHWEEEGYYPSSNFNNIYTSFYSVFIVLANDGWSTIYINHYRSYKQIQSTSYFISLKIMGGYILLNLFLAILLENYDQESIKQ